MHKPAKGRNGASKGACNTRCKQRLGYSLVIFPYTRAFQLTTLQTSIFIWLITITCTPLSTLLQTLFPKLSPLRHPTTETSLSIVKKQFPPPHFPFWI